jgi:hypothetical protein
MHDASADAEHGAVRESEAELAVGAAGEQDEHEKAFEDQYS